MFRYRVVDGGGGGAGGGGGGGRRLTETVRLAAGAGRWAKWPAAAAATRTTTRYVKNTPKKLPDTEVGVSEKEKDEAVRSKKFLKTHAIAQICVNVNHFPPFPFRISIFWEGVSRAAYPDRRGHQERLAMHRMHRSAILWCLEIRRRGGRGGGGR